MDTHTQNVITIDADSLTVRLESDGTSREIRVKPFAASILYQLFHEHPQPLSYEKITEILKRHGLIISDFTRMHRKLSEIRQAIQKVHPSLGELILNTRNVGYTLPLRYKNLHHLPPSSHHIKFTNSEITKAVQLLEALIHDAIAVTSENKIIKHEGEYIIDRTVVRTALIDKISLFSDCEKIILKETRTHEADFMGLRMSYLLAKLKTYVGLARISEYPISQAQWLDWFTQEVWVLFEDLKKLIRDAEKV
jgi:DNA-binding winged helix-turn-helix (wHTH) protein